MSGSPEAGPTLTLADRIAAAVRACPAVADLHGGPFGEVATYLPGRRVTGVRISGTDTEPGVVEIHVAGRYPVPVSEIARQVRAATHEVRAGVTVDVTVEDYL